MAKQLVFGKPSAVPVITRDSEAFIDVRGYDKRRHHNARQNAARLMHVASGAKVRLSRRISTNPKGP